MRRIADSEVEKMKTLANVHDNGDVLAVGVAEAALSSSTDMEDIAIDEGKAGL